MHQMVSTRNTHLHHHIVLTIGAGNIMLILEGGPSMASFPALAAAERADAIAMPFRQNDPGELVAKNLTRDPPTRRK